MSGHHKPLLSRQPCQTDHMLLFIPIGWAARLHSGTSKSESTNPNPTQVSDHMGNPVCMRGLLELASMYLDIHITLGDMAEDEADIEVVVAATKSPASSPLKTLKLVLGNETMSTIKLQQD